MASLRRVLRLTSTERRVLREAWLAMGAIRMSLWLLPFRTTRRLVDRVGKARSRPSKDDLSVERVAWAIRVAARFVPRGGHCLTQALATQILLSRHGFPAKLRFGVLTDRTEGLLAHAWVDSDGVIVVGGGDLDRYVELSSPTEPSS